MSSRAADAAQKQIARRMKLIVPAGGAKPAPPVGPAIGQAGLNLMAFCKDFNARTADFVPDTPMKCYITAYTDKSYDMRVMMPQTSWYIKKAAGVQSGAKQPGKEFVGVLTRKHIYEIALAKSADFANKDNLQGICRSILSQCHTMGIDVVADEDAARAKYPQCQP